MKIEIVYLLFTRCSMCGFIEQSRLAALTFVHLSLCFGIEVQLECKKANEIHVGANLRDRTPAKRAVTAPQIDLYFT
jgi:hypothetical protein